MLAGLFTSVPLRTAIWTVALAWMGIACSLNARQCSRTHCRFTGPYYLAAVIPVAIAGMGVLPLDLYGWAVLGILILGGSYVIWWGARGENFRMPPKGSKAGSDQPT
jgi:predicted exporter